jgi:hypothetical protein
VKVLAERQQRCDVDVDDGGAGAGALSKGDCNL